MSLNLEKNKKQQRKMKVKAYRTKEGDKVEILHVLKGMHIKHEGKRSRAYQVKDLNTGKLSTKYRHELKELKG